MIKKVIYFVLSILAIAYIGTLVADAIGLLDATIIGDLVIYLEYFKTYGGLVLVFLYASTNFTGNIFKIVLFLLLVLMAILFVLVQIAPINEFFRSILGIVA